MSRLAGQHILVTGAGAGIGAAVARRLAAEGASVTCTDLDGAAADATAEAIRTAGGAATAVACDVSDDAAMDAAFTTAEAEFGPVTGLVNNAGIVLQSRLEDMAIADFDRMIAVHLRGTFLGCRRAIGPMLEAGRGSIVNMASQLGQIGGVELTHYSAAKAGIIGLTKALAREVSDRGVRVNAVAPGPINTDLVRSLSADWRAAKAADLPLGRFGESEDVAATVAFLMSDDAAIYVGQTLGPNSGDVML
ncbi:3-oxoacyl-[acyl-carrier-protein] reductase FabG [Roseivivax jejudonensis]|uniref:3-oxoacyl-[acyl-carrier-protein] reductase FabG n=1 Tax=Roseivivax jejudonensis TaxID=1529041 RepID=A0A1X6Y3R2_9RHOB|nr:SDR family NAD(P)-dependent oxidoreductase [Roseivivax jejudonensis]SLN09879.1 3-oxoacyl-[acyl-carrier-protein] reductase FabG [Roseivivax jejudonensis]